MGLCLFARRQGGTRKKKVFRRDREAAQLNRLGKSLGGTLSVCLPQNGGVLSYRRHSGGGGVDYEVLKAIAASLSVKFKVVWYESEDEEESNPIDEVNAFMSYGLCQMAGGVPLHRNVMNRGFGSSVPLPRYRDMPPSAVGKVVTLDKLVLTAPYRSTRFVVVLPGGSNLTVRTLTDLSGKRILAEQGTVAGAIAMMYRGGMLRQKLDLVPPGPGTLWRLEGGKHAAAIIELDKFDGHRKQNGITKLRLSGYEHRIRYDIGLVTIDRHAQLAAHASALLRVLVADGRVAAFAERAGVTYRPPTETAIRGQLSFRELATD